MSKILDYLAPVTQSQVFEIQELVFVVGKVQVRSARLEPTI